MNFNPIIGLILTAISIHNGCDIRGFQSHYRSDFNNWNKDSKLLKIEFQSHYRSDFNLFHFSSTIAGVIFQSHYRSDFNPSIMNESRFITNFNPIIGLILTTFSRVDPSMNS